MLEKEHVIEKIKTCFDPEIPIDLWNLGLIYDIKIINKKKTDVEILMTLTTPGCTMGQHMADDIKSKLENIDDINQATVEVTFDPAWEPEMMSDEARIKLGFTDKKSSKEKTNWE